MVVLHGCMVVRGRKFVAASARVGPVARFMKDQCRAGKGRHYPSDKCAPKDADTDSRSN